MHSSKEQSQHRAQAHRAKDGSGAQSSPHLSTTLTCTGGGACSSPRRLYATDGGAHSSPRLTRTENTHTQNTTLLIKSCAELLFTPCACFSCPVMCVVHLLKLIAAHSLVLF